MEGTIKVLQLPLSEHLPEIRVDSEESILAIGQQLNRPVLEMSRAKVYHHGVEISKEHSVLAVIADGILYRYVQVKKDGEEQPESEGERAGK